MGRPRQVTYQGSLCGKCGTRDKYVSSRNCATCQRQRLRRPKIKPCKFDHIPTPDVNGLFWKAIQASA